MFEVLGWLRISTEIPCKPDCGPYTLPARAGSLLAFNISLVISLFRFCRFCVQSVRMIIYLKDPLKPKFTLEAHETFDLNPN